MKLRNKKTGEIGWLETYYAESDEKIIAILDKESIYHPYNNLAELNEEWEDYEEGHRVYYLDYTGDVFDILSEVIHPEISLKMKQIGNYFETKEEAEKAVEELKAWKRLKDKGFRFERWLIGGEYGNTITFSDYIKCDDETRADLDLLFGGEE